MVLETKLQCFWSRTDLYSLSTFRIKFYLSLTFLVNMWFTFNILHLRNYIWTFWEKKVIQYSDFNIGPILFSWYCEKKIKTNILSIILGITYFGGYQRFFCERADKGLNIYYVLATERGKFTGVMPVFNQWLCFYCLFHIISMLLSMSKIIWTYKFNFTLGNRTSRVTISLFAWSSLSLRLSFQGNCSYSPFTFKLFWIDDKFIWLP